MLLFVGASMVMACQQNQIDVQQMEDDVFYAAIENDDQTRTTLDENNNVMWSANDQLTIFKKSSINSKYQVTSSSAGKTTGTFTKVYAGNVDEFTAGGELDHNVAVYPYQEPLAVSRADDADLASRYEIEGMVLPEEQEYVANSFAEGAFPMAAVSLNNELVFRNVCGGIKLQLKGTQKVTSIKILGNDKEKLAGNAVLTVYADEDLKPALTMASDAVKSVTLDCGDGVQLTETSATEFIIALPPVLFSKGFTATVTASDGQTYTVQTDKANTVLRSSLLVMPSVKLGSSIDDDDDNTIPVGKIVLNQSALTLADNFVYVLTAKINPVDATDQTISWSSDNSTVAIVDDAGAVKTISSGTAIITAEAGGVTAVCTIKVIERAEATCDYIDEYGVNHGKGIAIGDVVWAPVNCGYHSSDFKYGKLYQWGRKFGQGYSGSFYESGTFYPEGTYEDALICEVVQGPISLQSGQQESNSNVHYEVTDSPNDWLSPQNDLLWNSGTEENPIKTEYDPCPNGWRVPTGGELELLIKNVAIFASVDEQFEQFGKCYSGEYTILENGPYVFLPAAGCNNRSRGDAKYSGDLRDQAFFYWSSEVSNGQSYAYRKLYADSDSYSYLRRVDRYYGCSVRCVQE